MKKFRYRKVLYVVQTVGYGTYRVTAHYSRFKVSKTSTVSNYFDNIDSDDIQEQRDSKQYYYSLFNEFRK